MYVKSIVIDGFKSYGRRTEISGFDREFNAITGLNGSGKSNILDAICFVLGLQNLGQVRATLLQDLVYKQGQTGVTKASVTIIFDNSNKEQSPVGYETFNEITVTRQVVMGGKNKYLINGMNAPNNRVKDLFCSVQLNVNNPHFLVMQGRITKVLNMKPVEILSMIEEAAGTRMFESKKQQAEKTLEKKDAKLDQIDEIVKQDIGPKLSKLKVERGQYLEYKKIERELEHLEKIYIAWRFMTSKHMREKATENSELLVKSIKDKKEAIAKGQKDIEEIDASITVLQNLKDTDGNTKLAETESQLNEKARSLTKSVGAQKLNTDNIEDEKKRILQLEGSIKEEEQVLKSKSASFSKVDGVFQKFSEEEEADCLALEQAKHKFTALSTGHTVDDTGKEANLQEKQLESELAITQAQNDIVKWGAEKKVCDSNLKKKLVEMKNTETDFKKDKQMLDLLEGEVKKLEQQLAAIKYTDGQMAGLQGEQRQLKQDIRFLRDKVDMVESRDARLTFRYSDPEPNFNRRSVHGLVCKLIKLTDLQFAMAIEKAAGSRLYNVVVDTDVTCTKLLKNGRLDKRTTMIPLNKISSRSVDQRAVNVAQRLVGKDNVWPALSLVSYEPHLQKAMEFIFSSVLICRDLNVANKVCYHPEILKRCVTLDGDVCDPAGTLSGGAKQQITPILVKLHEIKEFINELSVKEARIADVETWMQEMKGAEEQYNGLKQRHGLRNHELILVRQRLQQTTHYQYQEEVNGLKERIRELELMEQECKTKVDAETKNLKKIQDNMKNAKLNRERDLQAADNEVKQLEKKCEQKRKERIKRMEEYDSFKLELEDRKTSIQTNKEQIGKHRESLKKLEEKEASLQEEVSGIQAEVAKLQAELKVIKDAINKNNKEISQLNLKKKNIVKDSMARELEIKQAEQDHDKLKQEAKDCKNRISDLLKNYDWIPQEEQFFGQKNGIYDFKETDPHEAGKKIGKLQETKEKLERNINTKAMNLLAKTEEQYNELMKKRQQVEDDKMKILEVIKELAEKKKDALKQAWVQVNKDFSSIFSTLLPGADAKLEPPDGLTVLEGLEFRVGFGGKWKESLGELSGGQRSLVALSLILAMLLFKPAPIYILDEVDAALDLSHTQNIGSMLKAHFKTSQFIIVSLKDGMFNNANVLFRTKFVDGMSTVSRTVQRK